MVNRHLNVGLGYYRASLRDEGQILVALNSLVRANLTLDTKHADTLLLNSALRICTPHLIRASLLRLRRLLRTCQFWRPPRCWRGMNISEPCIRRPAGISLLAAGLFLAGLAAYR